ncbi:YgdI/YgdR family lipoprotein [Pantoea deleyi]|uniref:YgdI/YgdR family lipoprotein n=1 Tax=Pantoea deleyi TaxID=470932 RepID=UPI0035D46629
MSKSFVMAVCVAAAVTVLAGCSSEYVMQTKSGEMIVTKGKPEIDKSTGLVTYKDAGGYKHEINRDQISNMVEK